MKQPVVMVDLSSTGCRIETSGFSLAPAQRVVVRPEGLEGLCATVVWAENDWAGLVFDIALYQPVVDHLCARSPSVLDELELAA